MEFRKQQNPQFFHEEGDDYYEDDYSENGAFDSDSDSVSDCDSDTDPSYCSIEDTRRQLSGLSIKKKSKSRIGKGLDEGFEKVDEKSFEEVEKIIQAGGVEKLKVEQFKVYLRKNGLRLTGNKETLLRRIKEHQEILNGRGEEKYPVSSFVLNCKGDACTGDIVMFEQNVYEMYSIASRSANGPPLGTRIVVGRIVKESYGAAKQQHTFTIEVLWSKGEKPLPPLHPLLIKGRNLYRLKTMRQKWEDEGERQKVLLDKHSRGSLARSARESRIQDKEMKKSLRENKGLKKERNKNQPHLKPNQGIQPPNLCSSINSGNPAPGQSVPFTGSGMTAAQTQNYGAYMNAAHLKQNQGIQPLNLCSSISSGKPAPQQSGPFMGSGIMTSRTQNYGAYMNAEKRTTEAPKPANHHPVNINRDTIRANGFAERHHHRPPLTSMNYHHPIVPVNRQGCNQGKLCKYYAQGRCFYGDNCKFSHN